MTRRLPTALAAVVAIVGASLVPTIGAFASATTSFRVSATVPSSLSATLPLLRLHFSGPARASSLPSLRITPALSVRWQQIGTHDVQAIAVGRLQPAIAYTINAPTRMSCAASCTFLRLRRHVAMVAVSLTWEAQLLAELNYLPVRFTPNAPPTDPTQSLSGTFAWKYANLPASLSTQWHLGADNIVLRGAVMSFQSVHHLAVTGAADATTWTTLIGAVQAHDVNPGSYNYVVVSETRPQTTTLYVAGHKKFQTLANTGIPVSPTALGTYPVYLRYATTTMSGTNPDGTHYHDPGIPWVSYFNGGDALHGFIRSTYGSPQSLGCIEMPFAAAQVIYPYTPIGTLITITS